MNRQTPVSALAVFSRNALYKSTFYFLLTGRRLVRAMHGTGKKPKRTSTISLYAVVGS